MAERKFSADRLFWKGHLYLGLFLIAGIWVFSLSGLLLNHPNWGISEFWKTRDQATEQMSFTPICGGTDNEKAAELLRALGIRGELEQVRSFPGGDSLSLTVVRPGAVIGITARPLSGQARVQSNKVDGWGVLQMLHTFTGVRIDRRENRRDWLLTRLWSLAIDLVAIGLLLLTASGLYQAFRSRDRRPAKVFALVFGALACCFYLFGPGWFF